MPQGITEKVVSGAATFGRVSSDISLYITGFVSLLLVGAGIYFIMTNEARSMDTDGTVSKCSKANGKYTCTVDYKIDDKSYSLTYHPGEDTSGDKVSVKYDPKKPSDGAIKGISRGTSGGFLIGGGIILFLLALLQRYIVHRSEFAAALVGTSQGLRMLGR